MVEDYVDQNETFTSGAIIDNFKRSKRMVQEFEVESETELRGGTKGGPQGRQNLAIKIGVLVKEGFFEDFITCLA